MTMTEAFVEDRIAELNSKLDFIVEEISHLKRVRNSAEDLVAERHTGQGIDSRQIWVKAKRLFQVGLGVGKIVQVQEGRARK